MLLESAACAVAVMAGVARGRVATASDATDLLTERVTAPVRGV